MKTFFLRLVSPLPPREGGQGLVEYAIVLGVIVVALFGIWITTDIEQGITAALAAIADVLQ